MTKREAVEILVAHVRCVARTNKHLSVTPELCEERMNELKHSRYAGTALGAAATTDPSLLSVVREANRLPLYPEARS